jgi:hypothetical protein
MKLRSCKWLNVTYSYWERERNMILFLKTIVSIINQRIRWDERIFLYWDFYWSLSTDVVFLIVSSSDVISKKSEIEFETWRQRVHDVFYLFLWISFFTFRNNLILYVKSRSSYYRSWSWSLSPSQDSDRAFSEKFIKIHRKRLFFMNEICCKLCWMNVKINRKRIENEM